MRVRPLSEKESNQLSVTHSQAPALFSSDGTPASSAHATPQPPNRGGVRKVLKVLDDRILVFDPPENNALTSFTKGVISSMGMGGNMGKKVKDKRFCFDKVFDENCGQEEVYEGSAKALVGHVMNGFHSTVFAYGVSTIFPMRRRIVADFDFSQATGCGKTHTISGSSNQPGIVFLIMKDLFDRIAAKAHDTDFSLTVSYLEIYNETIRDLLAPESGPLALRENNGTATPVGLSSKEPTSANDVVEWIMLGNGNRTVNATEANATSSRSHAVLTVTVTQKLRGGGLTEKTSSACLSVIDLAGSERASVTKNKGDRLIEGANINRSLLALGNCINALCDPKKRGHVPYRDSKLTRLLKQSLGGNCKTVMIVCVSPASTHYDETYNTLQYADRAKEIKTKAIRNVISVDRHVQDYCRAIATLQKQVADGEVLFEGRIAKILETKREEEKKEVDGAKRKLVASLESVVVAASRNERSRVEKNYLDGVIGILRKRKLTAFKNMDVDSPPSPFSTAASTISQTQLSFESLLSNLIASSSSLTFASSSSHTLETHQQLITSLSSTLSVAARTNFTLEVRIAELSLENSMLKSRAEGVKAATRGMTKVLSAMNEVGSKLGSAVEFERQSQSGGEGERVLREFKDGIEHANREAFQSISDLPLTSTAPISTTNNNKRTAGTRSPLVSDYSLDKVPRGGFMASPHHPLPVALPALPPLPPQHQTRSSTSKFARRSPKKGVSIPSRGVGGSAAKSSPRKRKGVQWRDETGDGWDLADTRSPGLSDEADVTPPSLSIPIVAPAFITPFSLPPPTPSSNGVTTSAEMMAASKRTTMGSLRHKPSNLSSLSEESSYIAPKTNQPFTFAREGDVSHASTSSSSLFKPSRAPLNDLGNSSFNSSNGSDVEGVGNSTTSGLFIPLVSSVKAQASPRTTKSKRSSTIGPARSMRTTRRTSFINPPPPELSSSLNGRSKSSRVAGNKKVASSITAAQRSPRKNSTPPGWAPGEHSIARIAARRESSAAAAFGPASTSAGEMSGGAGSLSRMASRESLAGKGGVWR